MDRQSPGSVINIPDGQTYLSSNMSLFYWARLKVADIMSRDVVALASDQTIQAAARVMTKKQISCVLVHDKQELVGILSQKDMMICSQTGDTSTTVCVSARMSQPVETVDPQTPVLYASMKMNERKIRRLPVISQGELVGIITQTDLVRAFESMNALRSVSEIMTTKVATISPRQTVAQAVDLMVKQNISSVLVVCHEKALGILTEKDVLRLVLARGQDPRKTDVVDVMSSPLVTIPPTHSVLSASRLMDDKHLHRLVVTDDRGAWGIVTRTDILQGYRTYAQREIQQELHMLTHAEDAIILLDPEGTTTYVNPAFLKLFGADSPHAFINQPFPPDDFWIEPHDKFSFLAEQSCNAGAMQNLLLRKVNGDYLSINFCLTAIKDNKGKLVGRQGVAWDITQDAV